MTAIFVNIKRKSVILLQIVMVSPRTHPVKNQESQSRAIRAIYTRKNKTRLTSDANCTVCTSMSYLRREQLI